ncbi:Hypothetical predicted protein [Lynx pardinus]|uniref:Uncharacterized protein n=1 Tax=Lynx pardinus TaxID=191816 RepID=A0A485P2A2_LYNPA|nr:Hypothetical predicted protein [Lynx pardinus]
MNQQDPLSLDSRHPRLQDGIICTREGEEAHGCQTRRAAELDNDVGFHPKGAAGAFQRGYYIKYVNLKKGVSLGFLWCWQLMCFSTTVVATRNSNRSG